MSLRDFIIIRSDALLHIVKHSTDKINVLFYDTATEPAFIQIRAIKEQLYTQMTAAHNVLGAMLLQQQQQQQQP